MIVREIDSSSVKCVTLRICVDVSLRDLEVQLLGSFNVPAVLFLRLHHMLCHI